MELQTLTFTIRGMTDRQAYIFVESLRLGISEFDGIARHGRATRLGQGTWAVTTGWESTGYLSAFRRSALYAKLVLSPNITQFGESVERAETAVAQHELAAA